MKIDAGIKNQISKRFESYSIADQIDSKTSELELDTTGLFSPEGEKEISLAFNDRLEIDKYTPNLIDKVINNIIPVKPKKTDGEFTLSMVGEEKRLIENIPKNKQFITELFDLYKAEENETLKRSLLLACLQNTHLYPNEAMEFFEWTSENSSIELNEWSNLFIQEIISNLPEKSGILAQPVSERDFVYEPDREFDVTMPLMFSGVAYTDLGFAKKTLPIPPLMFQSLIGKAMALVRDETFSDRIVLEKEMYDIHPDGSPHYEIFPFIGKTEELDSRVFKHNYRTEVKRPFYTSGMTELVGQGNHVIKGVQLSFARAAVTTTPEKYSVDDKRLVETVRGTFFGYGDISATGLVKNGFKMKNGGFQLTPKKNPRTDKDANTLFKGVFYGKLIDRDNDNKLDVNTIPVHCNKDGRLDYHGDGSYSKDTYRPDDW